MFTVGIISGVLFLVILYYANGLLSISPSHPASFFLMMHGVVYAFSSKGEKYLEAFNTVLAANTDLLSVHLNLNASVLTSRQCLK